MVLGVLFLIPAFSFAKSAPALSVEKMQLNGDYTIQVYSVGKWIDAGKLSFSKHYSDKTIDVGKFVSNQQSAISNQDIPVHPFTHSLIHQPETVRVRLIQKGGGAAHIDSVFLGDKSPISAEARKLGSSEAGNSLEETPEFIIRKLSKKDHDVIDAFGKSFELVFPANAKDSTLMLTARVEAPEISKIPFQFPLSNIFKQMTMDSNFYTYKIGPSTSSQISPIHLFTDSSIHPLTYSLMQSFTHLPIDPLTQTPFFKEFFPSGSGHPSGYTYGWVANDSENLYVKIDFTSDNTVDGNKDYTKVYVKTESGLKEFKVSENETKWGLPDFTYTDKVPYQHKVYDFKIPLSEIMASAYLPINLLTHSPISELQLAFAAYGTASPGSINYSLRGNNYLSTLRSFSGTNIWLVDPSANVLPGFPAEISSTGYSQYDHETAYDSYNDRYLVVWAEYRWETDDEQIYGRIINADGTSFTVGSDIIISNAAGYQSRPGVAYDSANRRFLVVWQDNRSGNYDIFGQLLDENGGRVKNNAGSIIPDISDPADNFLISAAAGNQTDPSVAYDSFNHRFLVAWTDPANAGDIKGRVVSADGTAFAAEFSISSNASVQSNPSVAYDDYNHRFFAVWVDTRDIDIDHPSNTNIYGQIINSDGTLTGWTAVNANFVVSDNVSLQGYPAVAYDSVNRRFLVVWEDDRNAPTVSNDIYGQLVSSDGSLYNTVSGANFLIRGGNFRYPAVAFNEAYANFMVTFSDDGGWVKNFALVSPGSLIPQTGQTICYDAAGKVATCLNSGQDGTIQAGVGWPNPRFVDGAGPEIDCITDKLTGLMWPKNGFSSGLNIWTNALAYANNLNLCGQTDWRMPNVNELESLINAESKYGTATWLNANNFLVSSSSNYWASTSVAGNLAAAWYVSFGSGYVGYDLKTANNYVLPVRDSGPGIISLPKTGQTVLQSGGDDGDLEMGTAWPSPRFTDNTDQTVTDNLTGLMWLQDANTPDVGDISCFGGPLGWQAALNYVACLNSFDAGSGYLGFNDWRLPNRKEIRSLVDYSANAAGNTVALPVGFPFNNVVNDYYWSSTTYAYQPTKAWAVSMNDGRVSDSEVKTSNYYVWPVRGGAMELVGEADIQVLVTDNSGLSVWAGDNVSYTVKITNNGPSTARSVFLTDVVAGATVSNAVASQGYCDKVGPSATCGIGNIPNGAFVTIDITATTGAADIYTNFAYATLTNEDLATTVDNFDIRTDTVVAATDINLTIFPSPHGKVTSSDANIECGLGFVSCSHDYFHGITVFFNTSPEPGYVFSYFDCDGDQKSSIDMDVAKTCTAVFEIQSFSLNVSKTGGTGGGTIISSEATPLINCGVDCVHNYTDGALVTVIAQPDPGSIFTGWSGDCTGMSCDLTMNSPKNVTAIFDLVLGGVNTEGDLKIIVKANGNIALSRYVGGVWQDQVFDGDNKGIRLVYKMFGFTSGYASAYYMSEFNNTPITFQSATRVSPTQISLTWSAGSTLIMQDVMYQPGDPLYNLKWTITNQGAMPLTDLQFFHGEDTYIRGQDDGAGYWDEVSHIVGVKKQISESIYTMYMKGITVPHAYESGYFNKIQDHIYAGGLSNTLNEQDSENIADDLESIDNGYALEWRKDTLAAGEIWEIEAYEKFEDVGGHNVIASGGPNGTVSPTITVVAHNATASFNLTPLTGYHIASVTGCSGLLSGTNYTTGPVTADCTITATFELNTYALTVNKAGTGAGTVTGSGTYIHGASVNVTANADAGSIFTGWSVDCSGTASTTAITMNSARTCTATFELTYVLTVNKAGAGAGTVTGAGTYGYGASVNVTASTDADSIFTGWSVDCSGTTSPTAVIMDRAKTCTATFAVKNYALTISKAGTGSGTLTGPGSYSPGSSASVTASADANSAFTGWGGDCAGMSNPATVTMDSAKTCTANFALSYYLLTINKTGDGKITLSPPGLSCTGTAGGDCYKYNKGQRVTLIARPEKDHIFKGWSSCSGTGPCQLTLDADKSVTASFEAVLPKISISSDGIDFVPGADNYLEFDKVRVGRLKTKTLKITNSGKGNLIISGQVEGADMDMFSRKMGGKVTIRPGKSYNIRVTFKPRSAAEKSAELIISSNDPEVPSFKIDLGGEGFIRKK